MTKHTMTKEEHANLCSYEAIVGDLLDIRHPGEPVRECVMRMKMQMLNAQYWEAWREWDAERTARVGKRRRRA